jgi:CDP-diglyceride synthetase
MDDLIGAIIGIALMAAFAGGLAWIISAPPLLMIIVIVLVMAIIDVLHTLRQQRNARI